MDSRMAVNIILKLLHIASTQRPPSGSDFHWVSGCIYIQKMISLPQRAYMKNFSLLVLCQTLAFFFLHANGLWQLANETKNKRIWKDLHFYCNWCNMYCIICWNLKMFGKQWTKQSSPLLSYVKCLIILWEKYYSVLLSTKYFIIVFREIY